MELSQCGPQGGNGIWQRGVGNLDPQVVSHCGVLRVQDFFICVFLLLIAYFLKRELGKLLVKAYPRIQPYSHSEDSVNTVFNY